MCPLCRCILGQARVFPCAVLPSQDLCTGNAESILPVCAGRGWGEGTAHTDELTAPFAAVQWLLQPAFSNIQRAGTVKGSANRCI